MTKTLNVSREMGFSIEMALEAGKIIKRDFALGMLRKLKPDGTAVTKTDIGVNETVMEAVKKNFPGHHFYGEEKSDKNKSNHTWVCDPIDGTGNYTSGTPIATFCLSYVKDGVPITGVINDPFSGRLFTAERGRGAFMNEHKMRVSDHTQVASPGKRALIGLTYWRGAPVSLTEMMGLKRKLMKAGADVKELDSISYMGALVACGEYAASIHPSDKPFESASLKVIISEAGGRVTNFAGIRQKYDGLIFGAVMSNGHIHERLLDAMRKH